MRLRKDGTPCKKPGRKPIARPPKEPKDRKGPRPHVWLCGPDEFKHSLYTPWMKAKAQANFRKEEWTLTFEEFYDLWKDHWHLRGRDSASTCMTREDFDGVWSKANTILMSRKEHLARNGGHLREVRGSPPPYKPKNPTRGRPKTKDVVYAKMKVSK